MTSTMTNKGRITIPKQVREKLNLKHGSRLDFIIEPSGKVMLSPKSDDWRSLGGIVKSPHKRPVTIKEMNEAIADGYSGT